MWVCACEHRCLQTGRRGRMPWIWVTDSCQPRCRRKAKSSTRAASAPNHWTTPPVSRDQDLMCLPAKPDSSLKENFSDVLFTYPDWPKATVWFSRNLRLHRGIENVGTIQHPNIHTQNNCFPYALSSSYSWQLPKECSPLKAITCLQPTLLDRLQATQGKDRAGYVCLFRCCCLLAILSLLCGWFFFFF